MGEEPKDLTEKQQEEEQKKESAYKQPGEGEQTVADPGATDSRGGGDGESGDSAATGTTPTEGGGP